MDIERISNKHLGSVFKPLYVKEYTTVKQVLKKRELTENSELILLKIASKYLAFSKKKMAFHHIAQGYVDDSPYMVTFCVICNSGMVMNPIVNNEMVHFYIAGAYNGMLLMTDKETGSYWDHITGNCLSGKYKDKQLEILDSHQILTLKEVVEQYPNCLYGREKMNFMHKLFAKFATWKANVSGKGFLPPGFRNSMEKIDDRLPEMEMGLGVWEDKIAKFYPSKLIKENGNCLFDYFNDKYLLTYISPITHTPSAIYLEEASDASFNEGILTLSNGNYIKSGNLYSSKGEEIKLNKPNCLFLRWYGFVSTFSKCEIKMTANNIYK